MRDKFITRNDLDLALARRTGTALIDLFYPVGTVYETTDSSFDPNAVWGGTWSKIEGRMLLGSSSDHAINSTGGEENVTLTTSQVPSHTHSRGTMDITGSFIPAHSNGVCFLETISPFGAFYTANTVNNCGVVSVTGTVTGTNDIQFKASRSWTGSTSSVGGDGAHNNMPPYYTVNIWRRTA